ncbi:hypothetical protein DIPPA_02846 [Diplonema papillatum]|nr:hypothetical protein DIPPA_02846 [Diplonema papillatum]|eukprot:gene22615-34609_t
MDGKRRSLDYATFTDPNLHETGRGSPDFTAEKADQEAMQSSRWLVLLAFCYNTACNSFMFMNFATVEDIAKESLGGIGDGSLNFLYSASLLAVLPFAFPVSYLLDRYNVVVTGVGVLCNVIGAWLRYLSIDRESYAIALLSSVFIGCSAAVIITSVAHVPQQWFVKGTPRQLATSIGVQANYAGWCLGSLLMPYGVDTKEDYKDLLRIQAFFVSLSLLLFFAFHRQRPAEETQTLEIPQHPDHLDSAVNASQSPPGPPAGLPEGSDSSFVEEFVQNIKVLAASKSFLFQLLCYSALGGISFTIPAIQGEVFSKFTTHDTAWTNFAFIFTGVIGGLTFGTFKSDKVDNLITACFFVCSASVTLIIIVGYLQDTIGFTASYVATICLMSMAGLASLGFIGPALSKACRAVPAVSHSWSGGAVEWCIQVWGAVLTQVSIGSVGFSACAALAWTATALLLVANRFARAQAAALDRTYLTESTPLPTRPQPRADPSSDDAEATPVIQAT